MREKFFILLIALLVLYSNLWGMRVKLIRSFDKTNMLGVNLSKTRSHTDIWVSIFPMRNIFFVPNYSQLISKGYTIISGAFINLEDSKGDPISWEELEADGYKIAFMIATLPEVFINYPPEKDVVLKLLLFENGKWVEASDAIMKEYTTKKKLDNGSVITVTKKRIQTTDYIYKLLPYVFAYKDMNPIEDLKIGKINFRKLLWTTEDVFVKNDYAFVVDKNGLKIVDVSDIEYPYVKSKVDTNGSAIAVFVNNHYAYIADGERGLKIIDISDTVKPKIVGELNIKGYANGVTGVGEYIYLTVDGNLKIIDVTNPGLPVIIGEFNTDGNIQEVFLKENYAYIADGEKGLKILDISNPKNYKLIGAYETDSKVNGVFALNNYIYLAMENGLLILDISNPANPNKKGFLELDKRANKVFVNNNYAYIAKEKDLLVVDVKNISNPVEYENLKNLGLIKKVFLYKNSCYLAIESAYPTGGLKIINSDPDNLTVQGAVEVDGNAQGIFVKNNYAYIADAANGIRLVNISQKNAPNLENILDNLTNFWGMKVKVKGHYTYTAGSDKGVKILDILEPDKPKIIGSIDTYNALDIYIVDNYIYVADGSEGLKIIDISNPNEPYIIGIMDTSDANGIYVKDNYAYIADESEGLKIIDISDPYNPFLVGALNIDGFSERIVVSDNYTFLASFAGGVKIIDISNPKHPILKARINESANDLYVDEKYIYIADGYGLKIYKRLDNYDFNIDILTEKVNLNKINHKLS